MPESSQFKQEFRSLGPGNLQASPGDHTHDGITSKGAIEYTPSWTTSGTQPAIGDGTIYGRYVYLGNMVHVFVQITMGSTTTYGTGQWRISLPTAGDGRLWNFQGIAYDLSAVAWETVVGLYPATGTNMQVKTLTSVGAAMADLSSTVPFIWASGDMLQLQGQYGYVNA